MCDKEGRDGKYRKRDHSTRSASCNFLLSYLQARGAAPHRVVHSPGGHVWVIGRLAQL